jgi:hypothetical protein
VGGRGTTTPEGAELADAAPIALPAVTTTRKVLFTSAAVSMCCTPVSPDNAEHSPPAELHRCHW